MLVSVTIPVYNDSEGLKRSLQSLIEQTYTLWEAVVVDDGSLISPFEIISSFQDERIRFHRFKKNKGRPAARQKTFEMMSGVLCAFLDAGDYYNSDYLENAVREFHKHQIICVSQSMLIKYEENWFRQTYNEGLYDLNSKYYKQIAFASTVFLCSVCKNYVFDKSLKYSQDKHFLNYIADENTGSFVLLNSSAYIYDQGSNMKLKTTIKKYYYAMQRMMSQNKYMESFATLVKGLSFLLVHFVFGYQKLLSIRYKKINTKSGADESKS